MRVFIDPGHGGQDPGATFNGLVEKDIVLQISMRLVARLKKMGHECLVSRGGDYFVPLSQRADMSNQWKAQAFLSVHLNADPDADLPGMPEADGHEFWIYPQSFQGLRLAEAINKNVAMSFPEHANRGIKEGNFAVLRLTKCPAVILELAFIDTLASSRLVLPTIQERLAQAISGGVSYYSILTTGGVG